MPKPNLNPDHWMPKVLASQTLDEIANVLREWLASVEKVNRKKTKK